VSVKKPVEIDRRKSSIDILERVTHGFHAPKQRPVEVVNDQPRRQRRASKRRAKKGQ